MIPLLSGGFLPFLQVSLRLDEVCLERRPGLLLLRIGVPGPSVFLKLSRFCDKAVCDADNLSLSYWIVHRGRVINALFKPRVEAFEWFIGIIGLPEISVILR